MTDRCSILPNCTLQFKWRFHHHDYLSASEIHKSKAYNCLDRFLLRSRFVFPFKFIGLFVLLFLSWLLLWTCFIMQLKIILDPLRLVQIANFEWIVPLEQRFHSNDFAQLQAWIQMYWSHHGHICHHDQSYHDCKARGGIELWYGSCIQEIRWNWNKSTQKDQIHDFFRVINCWDLSKNVARKSACKNVGNNIVQDEPDAAPPTLKNSSHTLDRRVQRFPKAGAAWLMLNVKKEKLQADFSFALVFLRRGSALFHLVYEPTTDAIENEFRFSIRHDWFK